MISSTSSSGSARVAAALLLCGCAAARKAEGPHRGPIAVLPPANLSGVAAPMQELRAALLAALREQRVEMVGEAAVEEFLAAHRVRFTGGVDRATALAARAELRAESILVTSIELYQHEGPPKLAVGLRLVSAGEEPAIVYADAVARSGDQSPGLFELGLVNDPAELRARVLGQLASSLSAWREGRAPHARRCAAAGRFAPRHRFRSPKLDAAGRSTVAVLPFLNETQRRSAGELLALQFARQLEAAGLRAVEPGVVRDELLRYRIVMENGVSLDDARIVSELLHADLVLAGYVRDHADGATPALDFTVLLLDRQNSEILWQSTSHNRGDDGVWFFDAGRVATAAELSCRMIASVVAGMVGPSD